MKLHNFFLSVCRILEIIIEGRGGFLAFFQTETFNMYVLCRFVPFFNYTNSLGSTKLYHFFISSKILRIITKGLFSGSFSD